MNQVENPTHPEYVTERREATFEELRKLFPAVERAAVNAIEATVAHVEGGSCYDGAVAFLDSLGIAVPTEERDVRVYVEVPVRTTVSRTAQVDVLRAAASGPRSSGP